jgi:subtilisin family serine protease
MRRSLVMAATAAVVLAAMLPARAGTDPYRDRQWGLDQIRATQSWSGSRGAGVVIAIIDSGIDLTHPDLRSKIASSYSCIGGSCASGGDDDNGHGSHVAGIAAAATGNGVGVAGVAPSAKLMAVKTIGANGSGACSDIEAGIRWAADRGADVINMSLGPEIFSSPTGALGLLCIDGLQSAAEYAFGRGAVVVISAGNDGLFSFYSSNHLLVVGATGPDDRPASYSNGGANIYAPGGDASGTCTPSTCVFSTYKDGQYASIQGTSMAAPHVSGVAAQLLAKGYSNAAAISRIVSTADLVNGIRRINAARAVGTSSSTPGPTNSSKPKPGSPRPPSSGGRGGAGATAGATPTSGTSAGPSVLPTKITPPGDGTPSSGAPLAAGPSRPPLSSGRAALILGATALGLAAAAATVFLRRRSAG